MSQRRGLLASVCERGDCASVLSVTLIHYSCLNCNHIFLFYLTAASTAHGAHEHADCAGLLKVIQSGRMRDLINNGSLSLAPLGLSVIVCTLAACVHLLPNLPLLNMP